MKGIKKFFYRLSKDLYGACRSLLDHYIAALGAGERKEDEFHRLFETYAAAGFPALRGAWEQRNAFADLPVAIRGESSTLYGTCAGVDDDGALLLRTGDGVQRVLAGDVSLRPLMDRAR